MTRPTQVTVVGATVAALVVGLIGAFIAIQVGLLSAAMFLIGSALGFALGVHTKVTIDIEGGPVRKPLWSHDPVVLPRFPLVIALAVATAIFLIASVAAIKATFAAIDARKDATQALHETAALKDCTKRARQDTRAWLENFKEQLTEPPAKSEKGREKARVRFVRSINAWRASLLRIDRASESKNPERVCHEAATKVAVPPFD